MADSETPSKHEQADVPALHASGAWDRLTSPLPLPSLIRRTPRGKRASWQSVIHGSSLPPGVMQLIAVIVRRTRLWPSEKADVARELCAHFADGMEAGTPAAELGRSFGEPKAAATLIRAAKRRGRPLWWQAWRYALRGIACLVLVMLAAYAVLALMFVASSPSIKRNFVAELNAPILAMPQESRAWPRYLAALRELGNVPKELETSLETAGDPPDPAKRADTWPQKPGQQRWPIAAAWVTSRRGAVEKIRHAAAMEHLGFPVANQVPEDYRAFVAERSGTPPALVEPPQENPMLVGVVLPYLSEFRQMARVLSVDARIAAQERDADRFVADVQAICGMAHQCDELPTLINKLVAVALLAAAIEVTKEPLATDLLDGAHLRDLAHTFSTFDDSVLRAPMGLERQVLQDIVQRTYSDNRAGDGHMTREGLAVMQSVTGSMKGGQGGDRTPLEMVTGPLSVAAMASRKDLLAEADRLYAMAEEESRLPLWNTAPSPVDAEVNRLQSGPVGGARYMVLTTVIPAISHVRRALEQSRQTRDGMLVAIALESFRRRHGEYPATLEALTPSMLPSVPPDRYDGKPLKYRLIGDRSSARPVVYSIGVDRVDDGGRGPRDGVSAANMFAYKPLAEAQAILAASRTHDSISGDWILYKPE